MNWLGERPDRTDLVCWLAIRADGGGQFYRRMLDNLINRGSLTATQETAARQARARAARADARLDPSCGGRLDGKRRGNAEYRVAATAAGAEARG